MLQPTIGVTDERMPFETYFRSLSEKRTTAGFWNWGNTIQHAPEAIQLRRVTLPPKNRNRPNPLAWATWSRDNYF